jgi:hypothetical protein
MQKQVPIVSRLFWQNFKQNISLNFSGMNPEAEFLVEIHEIQTKVWRVFLLATHGHLDSFALRFLFLQTHVTS